MTVVDCTAPLNRYTCYGAIEVVAIIIIIIIIINHTDLEPLNSTAVVKLLVISTCVELRRK